MSNETIEKLNNILQEDKWTRVIVNNYSLAKLRELDELVNEILNNNVIVEALDICNKHLKDVKKSIAGLYISGMLIYIRRPLNDTNLVTVMELFSGNLKWALVEHICNNMLELSDNKQALHTLAKIYSQNNETEKLPEIWIRIAETDIEDTTFIRNLISYYEEMDQQKAIYYLRKIIYRYIDKKQMSGIKDIWSKLLFYTLDDFESLMLILQKVEKDLGPKKALALYEELYKTYFDSKNLNEAIEVLKIMLKIDGKNIKFREYLIEALKIKYKDIPNISDYIEKSDFLNIDINFIEVFSDFEKYLFFAKGNFVYHQTWHVGLIKEVNDKGIVVDFIAKRAHFMNFEMAVSALVPLEKEDIRVLKAIWSKEKLSEEVKKNVEWALKVIIKSYKSIDFKGIKRELVPSVLSSAVWNNWSVKAKEILKTNPHFGLASGQADFYVYNEKSSNVNEKMFDKFRLEKDFFKRYDLLNSYINLNMEGHLKDDKMISEFINYFLIYVNNFTKVDHYVISSYVILKSLGSNYNIQVNEIKEDINLQYLLKEYNKTPVEIFKLIESNEIRKEFVILIKEELDSWVEIYKDLFPHITNKKIVDSLAKKDVKELEKLFNSIVKKYKLYKDAFLWILKHYNIYDVSLAYDELDLLSNLIKLLGDVVLKINSKSNSTANKRLYKMIINLLIKDKFLSQVLSQSGDLSFAQGIYMTCANMRDFPAKDLLAIKREIRSVFDNIKFEDEKTQKVNSKQEQGFLTTLSAFNKKQKELQKLKEVDIPQNSKEISKARALGDLKENAEYHAAKESQQFLTKKLNNLSLELEQAKIININDVKSDIVSFGTLVELENKINNKIEKYTILGPWESNPDKGIISYKSPLGENLIDSKVGDELEFEINDIKFNYIVREIKIAQF